MMNDISRKSLSEMIDSLITTSMKIFAHQDFICTSKDDIAVAKASRDCQSLNKRRNDLMRAIDERVGEKNSLTEKTYK